MVIKHRTVPEGLAVLGVKGADTLVQLSDQHHPAARGGRVLEHQRSVTGLRISSRPEHTACLAIQGIEGAVTVGRKDPAAKDHRLAAALHGEGPLDLQARHILRGQAQMGLEPARGPIKARQGPAGGAGLQGRAGGTELVSRTRFGGRRHHQAAQAVGLARLGRLARRGQIAGYIAHIGVGQALRHGLHGPRLQGDENVRGAALR